MEEQQKQPCTSRIQKWFIDLTNQLIKNYRISKIMYLVIKILEYMQLTYFAMRVQDSYHWNFSFVGYFSMFVNYTVVDGNIRFNNSFFNPFLYLIIFALFLVITLGVVIGVQAGWGKKINLLVKIIIPVLNVLLYFFKYILTIPTLQVIFICLSPNALQSLNIATESKNNIYIALGTLVLVSFLLVKIYIVTFYRESNPFSQMQHAGQTVYRACFIFGVKFLFSLYSILDLKGSIQGTADIFFVIVFLLIILQSHYEVGLYNKYARKLQFKLMYLTLSVGFLRTLDFYSPFQATSFTFVIPYFIFMHFITDLILDWQQRKAILLNLITNNSPEKVEAHILSLIHLIDQLQIRSNRIKLQGYLHIHRRQCRNGQTCPCQNLGIVRQRNQQLIKVEYFKLVVVLLAESRIKFKQYHKMDLFLGLVYHFRIKNSLQAIYAFTKLITTHKKNLINRLYVSYYLQRVEEDMRQLQEKESLRVNDINKFLEYTNKMVVFQQHVENCTKHHIEFWRLMLDSNPEIKRLQDLGTLITRNKDYLKEQFQDIFERNSSSIRLLTIYGKFLLEVTNEQIYNVKYLEKAESIMNNIKYSSKIDQTSGKYNQNAQTGVIVINGNQGQLGNIIHTNNLIKDLLGYHRNELLDRNVQMIMPKIYGDSHNAILSRYIAASQSKVNGHERVVPALNKQGFILPANALTKALPSLLQGIQIVGFLAKMQQNFIEDDQVQRNYNYILYRSDTQQVLGITEGCYINYHIHPSLVYGNPNNLNNQLKIKHLFGLSFQRSQEGKVAAALQAGEVEMTINTKALKDQFIVSKYSSQKEIIQVQDQQGQRLGVQIEIIARNILTSIYQGITIKLIAFYPRKAFPQRQKSITKRSDSALYLNRNQSTEMKRQKAFEQPSKTDSDDLKNLKDFKNFISIKSQPSAITTISAICICFILIICSSTIGLIINWYNVMSINQDMMNLQRLTLYSELSTPQMMTKTEQEIIGLSAAMWNISNFTSFTQSKSELLHIISNLKNWQLNILPQKYGFNPHYNDKTIEYTLLSSGNITQKSFLLQEAISNYISNIYLISANMSSLRNFTIDLQSNIYQKYSSAKMNEIYSLKQALSVSNNNQRNWYKDITSNKSNIIIIVSSVMIAGIILWLVFLLPYVLSVTKINNRVLSLFSLIPYGQICRLIYGCLLFIHTNLIEANISMEDLEYFQAQQNAQKDRINQSQMNSPSGMYSPSQMGLLSDHSFTQSNMLKRQQDEIGKGGKDSIMMIEEKFEKMKNSQDRNKRLVIIKFLLISLIIFAFLLFYLLYSLSILSKTSQNLSNYQILGRRPALIRNAKLLITEYLINPLYNPLATNANSIRNMNINMINQFYNLEASLLYLNLGSSQSAYSNYNNGDICSMISSYNSFSLFNQAFSANQCYSVHSQILQKGVKTGIVDALQSIRSLLSQYPSSVPRNVLTANVIAFQILAKYIQTPMLAILNNISNNLNSIISTSRIVILVSGCVFIFILLLSWRILWTRYLSELNIKIWRTKGLLNLIPMRIITLNDLLKNQFTSGQLEKAVR